MQSLSGRDDYAAPGAALAQSTRTEEHRNGEDNDEITGISAGTRQRSDDQASVPSTKPRRGWRSRIFRDPVREANDDPLLEEKREKLISITESLDDYGFDKLVFTVAATGFFTGSYCLFVTNTVMSSIVYVYYPGDPAIGTPQIATRFRFWVNILTLLGSIMGQIIFGILADKMGRAKFYGYELAIILVSTIGLAQTGYGVLPQSSNKEFGPSMSAEGWFYFWRLMMGVGIGAEYPLTAVLTAEWASSNSRARMLAAVFLMQPLGQLCASFAGWVAIYTVNIRHNHKIQDPLFNAQDARSVVDTVWRGIVGFGVLPALIAIGFRVVLPDPGRWTLEVQEDIKGADDDTKEWLANREKKKAKPGTKSKSNGVVERPDENRENRAKHDSTHHGTGENGTTAVVSLHEFVPETSLRHYLATRKNWPLLFGTCACWGLLDLAFYGLGINSSQTLALVWANKPATNSSHTVLPWNPDLTLPDNTIYNVLVNNAQRSLLTVSLGSMIGSIALLIFINRINRKKWLAWSFVVLAVFLLATGISVMELFGHKGSRLTVVLYGICQLLFNLGPNTLTFILPAEIFPTRFRCTLHGLSAACGKFGSVVIQVILYFAFNPNDNSPGAFNARAGTLGRILIGFSFAMAAGAPIAWVCIPDVQSRIPNPDPESKRHTILVSKTLEELAPGVLAAEEDGQLIGVQWWEKYWPRVARFFGRKKTEGSTT